MEHLMKFDKDEITQNNKVSMKKLAHMHSTSEGYHTHLLCLISKWYELLKFEVYS